MADDTYTEVTSQSWFSRLRGAFKGILVGMLLVLLACWLLFSNEGRAVKRYKTLKEGGGTVVSVTSDRVDAANDGQLVHTQGFAETSDFLTDPEFAVSASAVHLQRDVEMYQWRQDEQSETRKKLGGGSETVTTYSYRKAWSDQHIRSSSFKKPQGHQNPASMPYASRTISASEVTLGAFRLASGLISQMSNYKPLPVSSTDLLPDHLRQTAKLHNGGLYIGPDPASPQVGDLRITFRYVEPDTISVVAGQQAGVLGSYQASTGGTIQLLTGGFVAADTMFESAKQANKVMTWILRFVGFLLMLFGFKTIFRPLPVMADVVPALGRLVGAGTGSIAFLLAALVSLFIIATAWLYYRPWLAFLLIAVAVGVVFAIVRALKKAGGRKATVPPPPPPAVPPPPPPVPTA